MRARSKQSRLGHYFGKYGVQATVSLPITDEVAAIIGADQRGVLLALAEIHQPQGHPQKAIAHPRQLYQQDSEDVMVRLSLAEMLVEEGGSKRNCQTVVRLTARQSVLFGGDGAAARFCANYSAISLLEEQFKSTPHGLDEFESITLHRWVLALTIPSNRSFVPK